MKSIIYISLALIMGGSVWYSLSIDEKNEEKNIVNNKTVNLQINQNISSISEKKGVDSSFLVTKSEKKSAILSPKSNENINIKKLEALKKTAKTKEQKEKYEKMQAEYQAQIQRRQNQEARQSQAKSNYERQQYLAKQRSTSIDARKNYLALQQAMKNRNVNSVNGSTSSIVKAQVARENYINKQKEIIERMKNQAK